MDRQVVATSQGTVTSDGAGVKLRRVFGRPDIPRFDPFLLLDFFDTRQPDDYMAGFPWHPHRGIETITFLLSGHIEHSDSLGNSGVIRDGDCQWMTAGSGIVHQELPQLSDHLLGIQLWANLPAKNKMTPPRYQEIKAAQIPEVKVKGGTVRVICGSYASVRGPAQRPDIAACFLDITLTPEQTFLIAKEPEQRVFALLVQGAAAFDDQGETADMPGCVALYETGPAVPSRIRITAGPAGARLFLVSGTPIGEPVAWGGPIVMNTREELDVAVQEYRTGKFIKHRPPAGWTT